MRREKYTSADVRINKYNEAWFDDDQDNFLDGQGKLYHDNQSPGVTGDVVPIQDKVIPNQDKHEDNFGIKAVCDRYELSYEIEIVDELEEMEYHRDDSDLTFKVIKMDLEDIANFLNNLMDDFLMEYKEMEHELDSTKHDPMMNKKYSQLLPGDLVCVCHLSCGWRQLIVVYVRNLMRSFVKLGSLMQFHF